MSIQEELEININEMNKKLSSNKELTVEDIEVLLLSSLIQEEGNK
jgi:hypothetical protein